MAKSGNNNSIDHGAKARMIVDALMVVIMPLLMAYSLVGETLHEVLGAAIFVLFILLHALNIKWFGALAKGKYNAARALSTAVNFALLIFMFAQPVFGIMISKQLFTFLPESGLDAFAREMHLFLAFWGFVLMSFHAGTHMGAMFAKMAGKKQDAASGGDMPPGDLIKTSVTAALALVSFYGAYSFFTLGFPGYMTMKMKFWMAPQGMLPVVLGQYLSVMMLFAVLGYVVNKLLFGSGRGGKSGKSAAHDENEQSAGHDEDPASGDAGSRNEPKGADSWNEPKDAGSWSEPKGAGSWNESKGAGSWSEPKSAGSWTTATKHGTTLRIRKTREEDLDTVMKIYAHARDFMAEHGNPNQWGPTNWPPEELIKSDIEKGESYVAEASGKVAAVFYYVHGEDIEPTYREITDGEWMTDVHEPYGVVHRIASDGTVKGAGAACIDWAYRMSGHLRMDTHGDNKVMQNLLSGLGFVLCGTIYVEEDDYPRLAYEKTGV